VAPDADSIDHKYSCVSTEMKSITRLIKGATLGIIGFGSIGKEVARLMRSFDVKTMALNTSGKTIQDVDL
jgi:phosphoglycerate dehydrogenase-like enzyme